MTEEKAVLGKSAAEQAAKSDNKILQDVAERVKVERKELSHYSKMHHRHSRR